MCSVNTYGHPYMTEPRSTLKTAVEELACVLGAYVPGPMRRVDQTPSSDFRSRALLFQVVSHLDHNFNPTRDTATRDSTMYTVCHPGPPSPKRVADQSLTPYLELFICQVIKHEEVGWIMDKIDHGCTGSLLFDS